MKGDFDLVVDAIPNAPYQEIPTFNGDLFSVEALVNPFPLYREIRDLGPVVRLTFPDVYVLSRYEDVRQALRSPEALVNGRGIGFNEISNSPDAEPSTLNSDGERHHRLRMQVARPMLARELVGRRGALLEIISTQIKSLVDTGWFDGVEMLAQHLPVQVVSHLVGLPEEGRQNMLRWASAGFNLLGPRLEGLEGDIATRQEARQYLLDVKSDDLLEGSWTQSLFRGLEAGKLTLGEARAAMGSLVFPSLDTTIYASANLLYNLGINESQWRLVKSEPGLIPGAVIESVRHSAVVRWFSRVAIDGYQVSGVAIPAGARVMLIYGSANRDERHFPDPDRFDVMRNPTDQLGWGTGPHMCAGMHLAKLEMEVLTEALVANVAKIEVGDPVVGTNQGLYGYVSLPMRLST